MTFPPTRGIGEAIRHEPTERIKTRLLDDFWREVRRTGDRIAFHPRIARRRRE
jgi:hypothetical protein